MNNWVIRLLTVSGLAVFYLSGMLSVPAFSGQNGNGMDRAVEDIRVMIDSADRYFAEIHQDISGLEKAARLYRQVL